MFIQIIPYVKATCQALRRKASHQLEQHKQNKRVPKTDQLLRVFRNATTLRTTNALQCYKERSEI